MKSLFDGSSCATPVTIGGVTGLNGRIHRISLMEDCVPHDQGGQPIPIDSGLV